MIALRQIQTLDGNSLTIQLPPEFKNYKQTEIIVLPSGERVKTSGTEQFIQRFAGSIVDFPEVEFLPPEERDSLE